MTETFSFTVDGETLTFDKDDDDKFYQISETISPNGSIERIRTFYDSDEKMAKAEKIDKFRKDVDKELKKHK